MVNINFIQDPLVLETIQGILDLAGPNFAVPFDTSLQPANPGAINDDELVQYDLPGGTTIRSTADSSLMESMGNALSSVMSYWSSFISAFGLILPILGIIKAIIEVLCAMMNPIAVVKAIARLFKKWIPAFISLFPPLAGVVIVLGIIKLILAVVFYILTTIVPTIQLIVNNIKSLVKVIQNKGNTAQKKAIKDKLSLVISEIFKQLGILSAIQPIIDIIMLILQLVAGFPCKKKKKKKKTNGTRIDITEIPANFSDDEDDSSCCDDTVCPPEIVTPPSGVGILTPSFFGNSIPFSVFALHTNNLSVGTLAKYNQSLEEQLNAQLDEEVNVACPPGSDSDDCPIFQVRITGRRGGGNSIVATAIRIVNTGIVYILNPLAISMLGSVNYEILPNYGILVMRNMIGLACHPDVEAAKQLAEGESDLEVSVAEKFPTTATLGDEVNNMAKNLTDDVNSLKNNVDAVIGKDPPYDTELDNINALQDKIVNDLTTFATSMKNKLNDVLAGASSKFNSRLETDKSLARSTGTDVVTVIVTPIGEAGTLLAKNLPSGVDISVDIFTTLGTLANQRRDNSTGQILADLTSTQPGTATVTAKVNNAFISNKLEDGTSEIREVNVKFVADAILPAKRKATISKSNKKNATKNPTGIGSEREPR